MFKLAVFDLDGTLLNTIDDLADACNYALRSEGFSEHPVEAYRLFVGNGVFNLVKRTLPEDQRDSQETLQRVKARFDAYYNLHSQDKTRPYDGILSMLERLREVGVGRAVLSNKPDEFTTALTEQYFPGLVDFAQGQKAGIPIKPDPQAVIAIMDRFGVAAADTVYIGDSGVDMQTGNNAGVFTVGVSWGFRTRDELLRNRASVIVDNSEELLKIIVDKSAANGYTNM